MKKNIKYIIYFLIVVISALLISIILIKINSKDTQLKENQTVNTYDIRENDTFKPMHGTTNANISNMLIGVTNGFKKELEIVGVGYRFALKGNAIVISAGYSHPVEMQIPEGIKVESPSNTELTITGCNKELVGEFAANVRKVRQPEPYKGKGIRYKDEHIIRKEGKKAA